MGGGLIGIQNANTRGITGLCLEPHDLVLSKYVASRDKDRRFARDALRFGLVDRAELEQRLTALPLDAAQKDRIAQFIAVDCLAST